MASDSLLNMLPVTQPAVVAGDDDPPKMAVGWETTVSAADLGGLGLNEHDQILAELFTGTDVNFLSDLDIVQPTTICSNSSEDNWSASLLNEQSSPISDPGSYSSYSPNYEQYVNCNSPSNLNPPGDIHIDLSEIIDRHCDASTDTTFQGKKFAISDEERELLSKEGITLPTDMPLTKTEEKHVKRIRRKIKNKQSAADSRKRKKEYVDGLERRVEKCTEMNSSLMKKVKYLESENKSLLEQLKSLQAFVAQYNPSKVQAGSFMMIVILSFSLLIVPQVYRQQQHIRTTAASFSRSRSLLDIHTDEYGNILKDTTFIGLSEDQTPTLPLPWKYQTPALKPWNDNDTTTTNVLQT